MRDDELIFALEDDDENSGLTEAKKYWSVLIVDDDYEVHAVTKLALNDFMYEGKYLNLVSAFNAKEAKEILLQKSDFAFVLLDIVMESQTAGLDVINFIRKDLNNKTIRIIIRTGQPGNAPEQDIINNYDINDYKEKTELTTTKLYSTTRTALSQYKQISELEQKNEEIYQSMVRDSITNLYSRTKLYNDLNKLNNVGLILLDIDSFSTINNAYGYSVGDKLLMKIADILNEKVKDTKLIYRIESDNFILLFQNKDNSFLETVAIKLKKLFTSHYFEIDDLTMLIDISFGIVNTPHKDNLIQKSEMAINLAREKQDNKIEFYSENLELIKTINNNILWSKRLVKAINSNNILTYFQPIIECATGKIVKYETLVRLNYEGEIHSPHHFLGAARNAGLLTKITKIVFRQACEKFKDTEYDFSINITDYDLMDKEFALLLLNYCKHYDIDTSRVSIEILEEASINKNKQAQKTLRNLKALGFLLSVDDFGIEYSNFSQINSLDADTVKIDGSFIKDITTNKNSLYITQSILGYTKNIEVKTVAEFVHSKEIFEKVKELGVDYAQGYYFGAPKEEIQ